MKTSGASLIIVWASTSELLDQCRDFEVRFAWGLSILVNYKSYVLGYLPYDNVYSMQKILLDYIEEQKMFREDLGDPTFPVARDS